MNSLALDATDKAVERERCRRAAHYFVFDSGFLYTKDEQDIEHQVKNVPDEPYLRLLLDMYLVGSNLIEPDQAEWAKKFHVERNFLVQVHNSRTLFVEKSRDMFVTNLTCCFVHWRAKYRPYQLILVQSKNEEDAANLVFNKDPDAARLSFQESHLPKGLRSIKSQSYCNITWRNGSRARAIPEGARVIRSEHPSMIFSDEAAFQDEFGGSFTAALPAVQGGGFYLAVSSADPGEFEQTVDPSLPGQACDIQGFTYRMAHDAIPVVRVHYSAHKGRRPGTAVGDKWLAATSARYPGGLRSPRWRKEQEIDYGALGGTRLFPQWEQWSNNGKIVIPPFDPIGYRLYGSYDHGWRNPSAYHVHGIDSDGKVVTLFEFYGSHVPLSYIARIIKGQDVTVPVLGCCADHGQPRHFRGNPFAGKETWKRADPSIWAQDQPYKDGTNKSTAFLFGLEGVYFMQAERGADTTVAEWLLGHYWKDPDTPLYRITTDCPMLIWEIGQQRHKELSAKVALNRDQPEELVDKDNHAWDSLKYFLQKFPPKASIPKALQRPNTFEWWRKMAKTGIQRGATFRI